jgi:hypothetical protein
MEGNAALLSMLSMMSSTAIRISFLDAVKVKVDPECAQTIIDACKTQQQQVDWLFERLSIPPTTK